MTEPLTVTEIDAATKDELHPPCEITFGYRGALDASECTRPAAWIVQHRHCSKAKKSLMCSDCFGYWVAGKPVRCRTCEQPVAITILSAEPLR